MTPYTHFTSESRDRLQLMLGQNLSFREIAENLGKDRSSIQREVLRNGSPLGYISGRAHGQAALRRLEGKPATKRDNLVLMDTVEARIRTKHSPQQIAGRLKIDFPSEPTNWVSTETIYRWIYEKIENGSDLGQHLRQGQCKRSKRISNKEKRLPCASRRPIDDRPAEVEAKKVVGHWEGDTMEGARKLGYLGTYTERATKFLIAFPMSRKHADRMARSTIRAFRGIPPELLKTFTFDNGTEFAHHQHISRRLGVDVYFAHPHCSWERGLNEHTNGLLRQYFPKGRFLTDVTPKEVAIAVVQINNRPRKCLGYQTPAEAYAKAVCALQN